MLRIYFIAVISLFNALTISAQICTGTLGENIFLDGDFGEGSANLLADDPEIAPGYNYTTAVPPFDGSYTITNDMGQWTYLFSTWIPLQDNSPDPDGYFMVVNATSVPGLFYEQTITGLCENTLYEFSADIINLIFAGTLNHIDPNVSFLIDGEEFFSTGNIIETNQWETFGFTFTTAPGQSSLTLSLRNNAPGGIGNDLGLDNITFRACGPETFISPELDLVFLCEDDTPLELEATIIGDQFVNPVLQWQESFDGGITWQNIAGENQVNFTPETVDSGLFFFRFLLSDGVDNLTSEKCRVNSNVITLNIIPEVVMTTDTLCQGLTLEVGNSAYTEPGIFTDTLRNLLGCDSIVISDIYFGDSTSFMVDIEIIPPCTGFDNAQIAVDALRGGFAPFNFTFEGEDLGSTRIYTDLPADASYDLLIEDAIGCTIDTSIFISNIPNITLELGEDRTVELGERIVLNPQVNFVPSDFNWISETPIECIDFEDCIPFDFLPTISQQIILELSSVNGCIISDTIFVNVASARKVYIPNAFSPNGDGINDRFTVFGDRANVLEIENLRIFDRWGALLFVGNNFQPNDLESGWDGTFRSQQVQNGVYGYSAVVRFADGQVFVLSGELSLLD